MSSKAVTKLTTNSHIIKSNEEIIDELFVYAENVMEKYKIFPYVAFVVKDIEIIARGHNMATTDKLLYAGDITQQGDVMAVRNAQKILTSGNLNGYTLVSFMEPTILGFDVALWAGITNFVWCVNKLQIPEHYTDISYRPTDYAKKHMEIKIIDGIESEKALELVKHSEQLHYYPNST